MPELPEVETIKRVIEPQIQGLTIENITVKRPEVVAYPAAEEFCGLLTGQTISHMTRRGKFLVIHLNSNDRIILHLRMTGCLLLTPVDYPEEKHTRVIFRLSNVTEKGHSAELRFSGTRRFGRFWLLKNGEADTYSGTHKLGAEPLDKLLAAEYLKPHFPPFTHLPPHVPPSVSIINTPPVPPPRLWQYFHIPFHSSLPFPAIPFPAPTAKKSAQK